MTGISSVDPRTPGQLSPAQALFVADHLNLKGGGAGVMQPVLNAWVWSAGQFRQFWPMPPTNGKITPGSSPSGDWRFQQITMEAPGAATFSLTARIGNGTPVTLSSGATKVVAWNWYDAGVAFIPGAIVTYEMTALNAAGSIVVTATATLPGPPAPSTPTTGSITSSSVALSWLSVPGASNYEVVNASTGAVVKTSASTSATVTGLASSTTYSFAVRALTLPTYLGGVPTTGPLSGAKSAKTSAPAPTGPANGTYTIKPSSNATYQWGESGGQSAGWRSTSDDLYHGDGGSVSTRGKQAAHFFYGSRFANAFPDGLGSKNVTKVEIYMKRLSSGGNSAATQNRWYLHKHTSKPSGAPNTDNYSSAQDQANLAWGEGQWCNLPDNWGVVLINGSYKGVVWGYVAARYMIASNDLGLTTPNGTVRITIGS